MRLSAPIHVLKRRARRLVLAQNVAQHEALDHVAREEGFARWSLLSAHMAANQQTTGLLPLLEDGDLLLLAARPGHGKTSLGLDLLLEAARAGRRAVFFTLEYSEHEARERIVARAGGDNGLMPEIVTSEDISAATIISHLAGAARGTVAMIDYLQILDQRRDKPVLADQVATLRDFARSAGVVLGFVSQVDRSFDPAGKRLPGMEDIRMPNPIDLGLFSKACFLHDGQMRLQSLG